MISEFLAARRELRWSFIAIVVFLAIVLLYPLGCVLVQSFLHDGTVTLNNWVRTFTQPHFQEMLVNSFLVSGLAALGSALIAFFCAYGLYFTNISDRVKKFMQVVLLLPLFLPSITYGFAVIYSFGRMGLISQLVGRLPFSIYGFWGLLITDMIYTLPSAFLVLCAAFAYVDRRYVIVSRLMGDGMLRTFWMTAARPTLGAFLSAFVLAFFLAFTDFGIPVSIAGQYNVIATDLYQTMMGAVPDFGNGAVIAITMLIPSALAVMVLRHADRFNFRYSQVSTQPPLKNPLRDAAYLVFFALIGLVLVSVFAVIFVVPFVENWPYRPNFTLSHVAAVFAQSDVWTLYGRSLWMAIASAAFGTLIAFAGGMIRSRSTMPAWSKTTMDWFAMLTSTLPGMVLGVGFLFAFSGTWLQNTVTILVVANIVHFLSTPYLMGTTALSKLNAGWETTGTLLGDSWFKSVVRIIVPNSRTTLIEMFACYFINSMVTISALVFLTGSRTMVLTTRIKELQYFERFDAIFALSLMIFFTNVAAKFFFDWLARQRSTRIARVSHGAQPAAA